MTTPDDDGRAAAATHKVSPRDMHSRCALVGMQVHNRTQRFTDVRASSIRGSEKRLSVRLWTLRSIRHRDELLKYVLKRVHIAAMVIAHKKGDVTEDVVLAAKAAR
ncbi:hypothetical protein CBA19CS91_14880 [Paraburkholderia hospita]|nr:hypothetical protein CBA19CS91_14880 [Paraburkholderia hospita]